MMADILEFRADLAGSTRAGAQFGPAEVVIFPGVRIEREDFSLADRIASAPAGAAAARQRAQPDD